LKKYDDIGLMTELAKSGGTKHFSWWQRKGELHCIIVALVPEELLVRWDFLADWTC